MKITTTLAAAMALTLTACGGREAEDGTGNAASAAGNLTTQPDGGEIATDTKVAMNGSIAVTPVIAADFANAAAASDLFEIRSSQLAARQASSAGVKSYATMMIAEHTKSTNELRAAAAQGVPAVTPAPVLTAGQEAELTALAGANGAAFDTAYARAQVTAHENTLATLQGYAARGDQAALKAFAAKTAPVVEKHLADARALAN